MMNEKETNTTPEVPGVPTDSSEIHLTIGRVD
jgi:hypothetical protein